MAAAAGIMAGAQGATDMANAGLSAYFANRETNQSWQRQKAIMKSRYTWMVGDLKRAGLNPILAFGGSPGGGSAPTTPGVQGQTSNYVASAREGQEISLRGQVVKEQLRNIAADTANKESSAKLIAEQTRTQAAIADKEEVTKVPYDFGAALIQAIKDGEVPAFFQKLITSGKSAGEAVDDYLGDEGRQERIDRMKRRGSATTYGPRDTHRGTYEDY